MSWTTYILLLSSFGLSELLRPTLCQLPDSGKNCCFFWGALRVCGFLVPAGAYIHCLVCIFPRLSAGNTLYICRRARWSVLAAETFKFKYKCCTCLVGACPDSGHIGGTCVLAQARAPISVIALLRFNKATPRRRCAVEGNNYVELRGTQWRNGCHSEASSTGVPCAVALLSYNKATCCRNWQPQPGIKSGRGIGKRRPGKKTLNWNEMKCEAPGFASRKGRMLVRNLCLSRCEDVCI